MLSIYKKNEQTKQKQNDYKTDELALASVQIRARASSTGVELEEANGRPDPGATRKESSPWAFFFMPVASLIIFGMLVAGHGTLRMLEDLSC